MPDLYVYDFWYHFWYHVVNPLLCLTCMYMISGIISGIMS